MMSERWWAVIPARWSSRRLPGKVAAVVAGRSMLEHAWRAAADGPFERVVVATDSTRVEALARGFGAEVRRTGPADSGTQRASRVVPADVWVAVVQADLPGLRPEHLETLRRAASGAPIATLWTSWTGDRSDPSRVKVRTENGRAVDFSRTPWPDVPAKRHVGVYAFGPGWLARCAEPPRTARARHADLEQLSWLDRGYVIAAAPVRDPGPGVDTWEQLVAARATLAQPS